MPASQILGRAFKSRISLTQAFAALLFLALMFCTEGWYVRHVIFEESLYFVGVVLVAACVVGRAWSLSYIAGSKKSRLVTTGPYSLCRNPLYFSNMLGAVGLGLCTETFTITIVVLVAFALYYPGVIEREEERLGRLFGAEFESYHNRVSAFVPSLRSFVEDDSMLVSVRALRGGLRDLGAFVVGIGLIEFVEALHEANVLPTLLVLY